MRSKRYIKGCLGALSRRGQVAPWAESCSAMSSLAVPGLLPLQVSPTHLQGSISRTTLLGSPPAYPPSSLISIKGPLSWLDAQSSPSCRLLNDWHHAWTASCTLWRVSLSESRLNEAGENFVWKPWAPSASWSLELPLSCARHCGGSEPIWMPLYHSSCHPYTERFFFCSSLTPQGKRLLCRATAYSHICFLDRTGS